MKVLIAYDEIADYFEKRFNVRPEFAFVDEKTLEVSIKAGRFIPLVVTRIQIVGISNDYIYLSYDCSKAASFLISKVISYIKERIPQGIEVSTLDKRIDIGYKCFKVAERFNLSDICLENDMIRALFYIV